MFNVNDLYKNWCEQATGRLIQGNHSNNFYLRKIVTSITGTAITASHKNNYYLRRLALHYCDNVDDLDGDNYYLRCIYKAIVGSVKGVHSNHFYLTGIVTGDIGEVIKFPVINNIYCLNDDLPLSIQVDLDYTLPLMIGLYDINGTLIATTTIQDKKIIYHIQKNTLQHNTYYLKVDNKDYIGQSAPFQIIKGVNLNQIQINYTNKMGAK